MMVRLHLRDAAKIRQMAIPSAPAPVAASWLRFFRPSHEHSARSAAALVMFAVMLSRVIGYLREAYIAYAFGAGPRTDAYVAAFTIPDWLNYLVAGGTASITFISIFTRYTSEQREAAAYKAFSIIVTVMTAVLTVGIVLAEVFAPQILRVYFRDFTPEQLELCVYLTRILLPTQIFFYAGGIVSAVLFSKRLFLLPAFGGVFYNIFIILGGVALGSRVGIASLAYGALAGGIIGPFLLNVIGAARVGLRYRPSFNVRDAGFREWVWLSIPLMLGVSLVAADDWIMRYFANGLSGEITRLNYAKRLLAVPIAVLGQAIGQATLPFFARLYGERKMEQFSATVSGAVYRTAALSLALWSAQGLYARAFYAAGDTLTPMVAGTIITVASLPMYAWLFHQYSAVGLTIASDVGIFAHTVVLVTLLHRKRLVPISGLPWGELSKTVITALAAGVVAFYVGANVVVDGTRRADFLALSLISITWAGAVAAGLWTTRSKLLLRLRKS